VDTFNDDAFTGIQALDDDDVGAIGFTECLLVPWGGMIGRAASFDE